MAKHSPPPRENPNKPAEMPEFFPDDRLLGPVGSYAALALGATPERALEIQHKYDSLQGGRVQFLGRTTLEAVKSSERLTRVRTFARKVGNLASRSQ